jgi:hypothetical protein
VSPSASRRIPTSRSTGRQRCLSAPPCQRSPRRSMVGLTCASTRPWAIATTAHPAGRSRALGAILHVISWSSHGIAAGRPRTSASDDKLTISVLEGSVSRVSVTAQYNPGKLGVDKVSECT